MFKRASALPAGGVAGRGSKAAGDAAEARALEWLAAHGLTLLQRNYRVAGGPSAPAGEVDLVMRDRDGTLVFVEVRARTSVTHGGAAAVPLRRRRGRRRCGAVAARGLRRGLSAPLRAAVARTP